MNAKQSIKNLRNMADMWNAAANNPKYYDTDGSYYLAMAAQSLYQESNFIETVYERFGLPQLDEAEVVS